MTLLTDLQAGIAQSSILQTSGSDLSWGLIVVIAIIGLVAVAVAWLMSP
jgi:hypothetical protein